MKKTILLIVFVTVFVWGVYGIYWAFHPVSQPLQKVDSPAKEVTRLAKGYVSGTIISPKTTKELQAWFFEATNRYMPRVFVEKLPDDFAEKGTPDLFLKVMSALVLRENELAIRERVALIALKAKYEAGENWSQEEKTFFDRLVEKYDAGAKRDIAGKIADLMEKVDVVPVSLAVAMAAEATNWGRENLDHPFRQQGWIDTQNYGFLPFEKLTEATASYVREMNGMPPMLEWRISRGQYRNMFGVPDLGYRSIRWIKNYMPWDADYIDKIYREADKMDVISMDALTFMPKIQPYRTTQIHILTDKGKFLITAEITEEEWQRRRGLMFRDSLAEDKGMLFLYPTEQENGVWMKNTFIPLDVLFFDATGKITHIVPNIQPLDETIHTSNGLAAGMLELSAGSVQRMHIQIGDRLVYNK